MNESHDRSVRVTLIIVIVAMAAILVGYYLLK